MTTLLEAPKLPNMTVQTDRFTPVDAPVTPKRGRRAVVVVMVVAAVALVGIIVGGVNYSNAYAAAYAAANPDYTEQLADAEARAESMGIEITYSAAPCGEPHWGGCYNSSQPDVIVVKSGMSDAGTQSTILHELAHAHYFAIGYDDNECDADDLAIEWGAIARGYKDCTIPAARTFDH